MSTPRTTLERLTSAYSHPLLDPSPDSWRRLLNDPGFESQPVAVVEFARLRDEPGARQNYEMFVQALSAAIVASGGDVVAVNDVLMPGLEGLDGYTGGLSWVAQAPSLASYVEAMLDEQVIASAVGRRAAIDEAQLLVGPNLLPEQIKNLPPNLPASDFPRDRVKGKRPEQIVDELLRIYPSGGADPTRDTLEAMVGYEGFLDQRVHYINLYQFNEQTHGGESALNEYNAEALPVVLAHGGRPKVLANVTHHLVGPTAWDRFIFVSWPSLAVFTNLRLHPTYIEAQRSRVLSGERYGNLITIAREDNPN